MLDKKPLPAIKEGFFYADMINIKYSSLIYIKMNFSAFLQPPNFKHL